jgi:hypothetical protein
MSDDLFDVFDVDANAATVATSTVPSTSKSKSKPAPSQETTPSNGKSKRKIEEVDLDDDPVEERSKLLAEDNIQLEEGRKEQDDFEDWR